MVRGFWKKFNNLNRPFFALAPMADVTDVVFRQIIAKYSRHGRKGGGPDVFWTEFVSADGLVSKGREKLLIDLKYLENERPIVAQLFGAKPDNMREAAKIVASLGFDGIDINMGCPDKTIEKQGAGAALMKNPRLAREIIQAARDGAPDLPISVKTRIGYNRDEIDTWIKELLKEDISALTIHARTRKEMSKSLARWEKVRKVAELIKKNNKEILVIGNGDALGLKDGRIKAKGAGADGVMLGRAVFGNPWLFDADKKLEDISIEEKLRVMVEHTELFEKLFSGTHPVKSLQSKGAGSAFNRVKNFAVMKKHYKAYVSGFDGAKELRMKLMKTLDAEEVAKIVSETLKIDRH